MASSLCDPVDCNPPSSSVHGILQARILEWVTIPSSRGSSWPGMEAGSPTLQADSLPSEPPGKFLDYFIFNSTLESESRSAVSDSLQPHGL